MMYVEAPSEWTRRKKDGRAVFLAGGITDCPDWQAVVRHKLKQTNLVVINPRRAEWPMGDPSAAEAQITWEHEMLEAADFVSFWFPAATLCPITLYELGAWSQRGKSLIVGCEPGYARTQDVEVQTRLARPEVEVVYSLDALCLKILDEA